MRIICLVFQAESVKPNLGLFILALIAAALAGAYYILTSNSDPSMTGKLYSFSPTDTLTQIRISNNYGTFLLTREEDEWILTEPGVYRVNQQKVSIMEKFLLDLPVNRILDTDLPEYGLSKPAIIVEFSTAKGISKKITIGNLTPSKAQIYLKDIESGKVIIVDTGAVAQFDGSLNAYRGKEIFSINKDQISEITYLQNGDKVLTIKNFGPQNWQLTYPFSAPARIVEISEMIVKMRKWSAAGYPENISADYQEYGLDNPANTLLITDSNGKSQKMDFGNSENGMIYVRTGSQEDIAKLFSVDIDFSLLTVEKLLFVAPLQSTIDNVSKIQIKTGSKTSAFTLDHSLTPIKVNASGREANYEDFVSLFVSYISLSADGFDDNNQPGEKYLSLITTKLDGSEISVNLLGRDESSYFIDFSGSTRYFINKDKVEKLLYRLEIVETNLK